MADTTPRQDPSEAQPRVPPSLAVGDRPVVTVDDVAFGGDGVARHDEFVVFVPFTAQGETVEIEIVEVKRRFARGRLLRVLDPSPDRVAAPCRYFGECGGCQYQHLDYPAQLKIKHAQVTELLRRIGRFSHVPIDPVVPSPLPYGYRNRILVRSQWNGREQRLVIGFLGQNNRWVVDMEECLIAEPELNERLREVRLHPPPKGGIKVALRRLPEDWVVPADSFFQNNFHLLPGLVDVVRQRLRSGGCRYLVDAYCGVGFFSIELADMVEGYAGIELDLPAVRAARDNAARRNRRNGEFLLGSVEMILPEVLQRFPPDATALILDPPRRGCARASLEFLREQRPAQILYVSCHPATLARDLLVLTETGCFQLERVVPVDMFPQTQHVELVADLRLQPCQAASV
jgi:tRNA/tmRNA/rRNA uracil-C5-methylase (TrmA/RlmC/RlmD family)